MKRVRRNINNSFGNEEDITKMERIQRIMEQETNMADIRIAHEKRITAMKEDSQRELHKLEIRAATAKAELAELQLEKEKEKIRI